MKFIETDSKPICSHCEIELNEIHTISKGFIIQNTVYLCPHCHKILSIGYNTP